MELAVVGNPRFVLGFRLAGVRRTHAVEFEQLEETLVKVTDEGDVGILVVDNEDWIRLPPLLRRRLSNSIDPVVISIGKVEEVDLRERIKQAVGVDLWK